MRKVIKIILVLLFIIGACSCSERNKGVIFDNHVWAIKKLDNDRFLCIPGPDNKIDQKPFILTKEKSEDEESDVLPDSIWSECD